MTHGYEHITENEEYTEAAMLASTLAKMTTVARMGIGMAVITSTADMSGDTLKEKLESLEAMYEQMKEALTRSTKAMEEVGEITCEKCGTGYAPPLDMDGVKEIDTNICPLCIFNFKREVS